MRKIYIFDLGLLVAAGTIAATLVNKPLTPDDANVQFESDAIIIPDVRVDVAEPRQASEAVPAKSEDVSNFD